jgi:peptide deformylase
MDPLRMHLSEAPGASGVIYPDFVIAMLLLPILRYPDPRLNKIARPVTDFGAEMQSLIDRMFATMYDAAGIGLAATQVDVHLRLVVIDVSEDRQQPLVIINPQLVWASTEMLKNEEGCLSVPGIYDGVERAASIRIESLDRHGKPQTLEADGLLAVCIQHEMDHLLGKVFVEYLSPLKRNRIKTKLNKELKDELTAHAQGGRR